MLRALLLASVLAVPGFADTPAERADELERLVLQDCGSCHGMTLKGGLGPDIRAQTLAGTSRQTLVSIILDGVPEKAMPAWRPLISHEDAVWIAEYLLTGERP